MPTGIKKFFQVASVVVLVSSFVGSIRMVVGAVKEKPEYLDLWLCTVPITFVLLACQTGPLFQNIPFVDLVLLAILTVYSLPAQYCYVLTYYNYYRNLSDNNLLIMLKSKPKNIYII